MPRRLRRSSEVGGRRERERERESERERERERETPLENHQLKFEVAALVGWVYVRKKRRRRCFFDCQEKRGFLLFSSPQPTDEGNLQSLRREANFEQHFKGECLNVSSFQEALRCTLRKILRQYTFVLSALVSPQLAIAIIVLFPSPSCCSRICAEQTRRCHFC